MVSMSRLLPAVLLALTASGCQRIAVVPCTEIRPVAAPGARAHPVTLRIDYAGAEAMLDALERDALSDAAVDSLLAVHGAGMMVDNVTRLIPELGRDDFRVALQEFVRTGRVADEHLQYNLQRARSESGRVRDLLGWIRANEGAVLQRTLGSLAPYMPDTGPLEITAYLIAGGTSTGFVPDAPGNAVFYANLADASGDCEGVLSNFAHETYHLAQKAAYRRVPDLVALADSQESLPLPERIMATVLTEGTADIVSDPNRFGGDGPEIARQRERYRADAEPAQVRRDFALFDTLFQRAARNETTWRAVLERGFMNEARFYPVGRAMAQAIDRHCGAECIRRQFERPPVEFFREYIRLYRANPEIVGRFSVETERVIERAAETRR